MNMIDTMLHKAAARTALTYDQILRALAQIVRQGRNGFVPPEGMSTERLAHLLDTGGKPPCLLELLQQVTDTDLERAASNTPSVTSGSATNIAPITARLEELTRAVVGLKRRLDAISNSDKTGAPPASTSMVVTDTPYLDKGVLADTIRQAVRAALDEQNTQQVEQPSSEANLEQFASKLLVKLVSAMETACAKALEDAVDKLVAHAALGSKGVGTAAAIEAIDTIAEALNTYESGLLEALGEKIDALPRTESASPGDPGLTEGRFTALAGGIAALSQRIEALEQALAKQVPGADAPVDVATIIAQAVAAATSEQQRQFERLVRAQEADRAMVNQAAEALRGLSTHLTSAETKPTRKVRTDKKPCNGNGATPPWFQWADDKSKADWLAENA